MNAEATLAAGGALAAAAAADADADHDQHDDDLAEYTRWESHGGHANSGSSGGGSGRDSSDSNSAGNHSGVAESALRISGMHCAACAGAVEQSLRQVPGVLDAQVSAATHIALVRWRPDSMRVRCLFNAVAAAGYQATPDTAVHGRVQRRHEARAALWRLFVAGFCAMQVMMLAAPAYVAGADGLSAEHKRLLDWGSWLLTLPVLGFAAAAFFSGAWACVRRRRIGMDVPVALGIVVAFVASSAAAWDPGGPFGSAVYFDSLTMFISFLMAGRWLELRARHRAEAALDETTDRLPQSVLRLHVDGSSQRVSVARLRPGDQLRVPVGEAFAADGELLQGSTLVDESLLSGEARPLPRGPGDRVVAGSLNLQAPVAMRATRVGADTRYEAIVGLMRRARNDRPAVLAAADRWAPAFLWAVLLLAAAAGALWSVLDPARAVWVVVSVLIVTCPCALSLAAPAALLAAASAIGRRGLLLRRLDAIEGLARMQTLFVDKTGTLTEGRLQCSGMQKFNADFDDFAVQQAAGSLAAWSTHPLSAALQAAWPCAAVDWRDVQELPGRGVQAVDDVGRVWRLGAAAWAAGQPAQAVQAVPSTQQAASDMQVWLACDGAAVAVFSFCERVRSDAAAAVRALQADGVRVHLLTGDGAAPAQRVASALGLDQFDAGLAPEDKLRFIHEAQQQGRIVAMLGDGINDAPVLAQANVSLAMGEGALIARAEADGVLTSSRLMDLVHARATARRALRVLRQNLVWAAAYNAACIPLALAGWLPPWLAGAGMAASSLVVVLNSMRLSR